MNRYEDIHRTWEHLNDPQTPWYTNLSNAAALLKEKLDCWWVGFYLVENNILNLGPFQGPTACTTIEKGRGVCGTVWELKKSLIVDNVHKFKGHIACSSESNSEIVIPMFHNNKIWGVLDIDSTEFSAFNEQDRIELEKFCASLSR